MTSIAFLRQIVTDIHSVAPQGARKAVRAKLAEQISLPCREDDLKTEQLHFKFEMANAVRAKVMKADRYLREAEYKLRVHLSHIFEKETNTLVKNTLKKLGIRIENKTINEIEPTKTFQILQGLNISKKAGFKLPKTVVVEDLQNKCGGYFKLSEPKKIHVNLNQNELCATTIHETAHKNDLAEHIVRYIPVLDALSLISSKLIPSFNKNLITKEVRDYAAINRNEFIACTAEKLLSEQKSWSDLDPKIKKLYKLFLGPKFKTNEIKT
jgi:hypothetical protein